MEEERVDPRLRLSPRVLFDNTDTEYEMCCVVSGRRTNQCNDKYRVFFFDVSMAILYAEWIDAKDHSDDEFVGVVPDDAPVFHSSDTFTMHHLKADFLRVMNDPSQFAVMTYASERLGRVILEYQRYINMFFNQALQMQLQAYEQRVLINQAQYALDNETMLIIGNNRGALRRIRSASQHRSVTWLQHMREFIDYWRPQAEAYAGPVIEG